VIKIFLPEAFIRTGAFETRSEHFYRWNQQDYQGHVSFIATAAIYTTHLQARKTV